MAKLKMSKEFIKKGQAIGLATAITFSATPVKLMTGSFITLGVINATTKNVEAAAPDLAMTKEAITVNGVTYLYKSYDSYTFDGGGWMIEYVTADDSKHIVLTNNLNLTPVKGASGYATIMHIDEYNKIKNSGQPVVETPIVQIPNTNNDLTFKPYVQGEQGKYNNDDVDNQNNYVFPKESMLTGTYLDLSAEELEEKVKSYIGKTNLTEEEAKDYIDICYSYAGKILGYIPGSVTIRNDIPSTINFKTDSSSYVVAPYSTIEKLMNKDGNFKGGYTEEVLKASFWEILRFVKEQDQIHYTNLKNKRNMIETAEGIRASMSGQEAYKGYTFRNMYSRAEDDILEYSSIVPFYMEGKLSQDVIQNDFGKQVNYIFKINMTRDGVSFDGSVPTTFNIVAPKLKENILPRADFINEIASGAKTINEQSQLKNSVSDYGFYVVNIYSNSKYGMNTETDKKIKEVITQNAEYLKSSNYFNNMSADNLESYLRVAQYGGGLTPNMINEIEKKDIYSLANIAMWYDEDIKVLDQVPYTDEEWAKIKPVVIERAGAIATKNKVKAGQSVWSEAFAKELIIELKAKDIDITRIHEYVFETEIRGAMAIK